ncbi:sigma-70 family RNA polymerase sigma factor [Olsenella uli]|uniref:RNA polymerase sigma factor n=1 Tax=Olsenella uli TaxID=133926 RepID=UPI00195DE3A0|nr:sigma-70 family RNA polymerase sigma factor [Olsenella uli]MBM6675516.1 sigma-70 family RNA polymerase sigma factor [Olsenella uli]
MPRRVTRDDAFLREAMRGHGASVLRLALAQTGSRADAEDVYQDVFVALACSDTDFADSDHLRAWLLRATLNRCRDLTRSWWRRHAQSFDALGIEVAQGEKDEAPWTDAQIWKAVQRLPERYRAVIHLRYVEQLPADAIAAACGISESAVRTRLSRAMGKLRVYLGGTS